MTGLVLGATPEGLTVNLVAGADAYFGIDFTDDAGNPLAWSVGDTLTLVFNDTSATTWPATLTTGKADWNVDKAVVAALVSRFPRHPKVQMIYTSSGFDAVWFNGSVLQRGDW